MKKYFIQKFYSIFYSV